MGKGNEKEAVEVLDDSFEYYATQTVDPGPWLIVATVALAFFLYLLLWFMVVYCERRKQKREDLQQDAKSQEEANKKSSNIPPPSDDASVEVIDFDQYSDNPWPAWIVRDFVVPERTTAWRRLQRGTTRARIHKEEKKEKQLQHQQQKKQQQQQQLQPPTAPVEVEGVSGIFNYDPKSYEREHEEINTKSTYCNRLLEIIKWDRENGRIMKLALPYMTQAMIAGIAEAARVAIIGKFYGTRSLAAYVVVVLMVDITHEFVGGIIEAQGVLTAQSIGVGNTRLTGQYTQAGMILYTLAVIPISIVWIFIIGPILAWFGFDEATVNLGVAFTRTYVWAQVLNGVDGCLEALLDISGHEVYSAIFTSIREITITLTILIAALVAGPTLRDVGSMFVVAMAGFLFLNVAVIAKMGWWRKYYLGMFSSVLTDWALTKSVINTAVPLSFGYLVTYGEWEILTIFAAFLGPAEVAAWGILGTLWDVLEECTESIAEAAEVRCAFLLGAGRPIQAEMSAYKSTLLGFLNSVLLSSIVLLLREQISLWLTSETTLQLLVAEIIPLLAIGNVALAMGTMAWTLLGAQGRYAHSTTVAFVASWAVTVPLAYLSSVQLSVDLQGQTAAVVVGYMISGTINTYLLLRSNWTKLSERVIAYNSAYAIDLDRDDEDSVDDGIPGIGGHGDESFGYRQTIQ